MTQTTHTTLFVLAFAIVLGCTTTNVSRATSPVGALAELSSVLTNL